MKQTLTVKVPEHLKAGVRLRHHKGGCYTVVGACLVEATLETGILYRPEQGNATQVTWMRLAASFDEMVQTPAGWVRRFEPV
jgi:hypothetical protein